MTQRSFEDRKLNYKSQINLPLETPLHVAALEGDINRLRMLLREGIYDVNGPGDNNFTALHFAADSGQLEVSLL